MEPKKWADDEVRLLRDMYTETDTNDIARLLGCTPKQIRRKAEKLSLNKSPEYMRQMFERQARARRDAPRKTHPELTAALLRELIDYDAETGICTWKKDGVKAKAGQEIGSVNSHGYRHVRLLGSYRKVHRLAWLYAYGEWPAHVIDHIDGNKLNNRLSNLRDVPFAVNVQNRRRAGNNSASSFLGVSRSSWSKDRWVAVITANRKSTYLGSFKTEKEAHEAYLKAKRRLHEGCTI